MIYTFDPKHPSESESFTFDFVNQLGTGEIIQSISVAMSVKSGTDGNPNAMLSGVGRINGTKASQVIMGGIDGNYYYATFTVITSAQTLVAIGVIPVRSL